MIRLARSATLLAALGVFGSPSAVLAFNEPDGFRGVPWGATEQQMRSSVNIERACCAYDAAVKSLGDRYCPALLSIDNVKVRATYSFRADQLVRVGLQFDSKDFDKLAESFVAQYGPPTRRDRDVLSWIGAQTAVALHRHLNNDPTRGQAVVIAQAEVQTMSRLRNEQSTDAAPQQDYKCR
jgi:hypothetical protein